MLVGTLSKEQMEQVNKIEDACCALMAGLGPQMQGAICACLVTRHLASFSDPGERAQAKRILLKVVNSLVPVYRRGIMRSIKE